jgi:hypothetical protein
VKSAKAEGRKSPIFKDDEVIGFGSSVRETGRKSRFGEFLLRHGPVLVRETLENLRAQVHKHRYPLTLGPFSDELIKFFDAARTTSAVLRHILKYEHVRRVHANSASIRLRQ